MTVNINKIGEKTIFDYKYSNEVVSSLEIKYILREDISLNEGINLISIHTEEKYRCKGYATKLIKELIKFSKNNYEYIILDDATEIMPPKNIYYKMGFMVKDNQGEWVNWDENIFPDEERLLFFNHRE